MFRRKLERDTKSMILEIILKLILPGRENGYCPKRDFVLQWIINFPRGKLLRREYDFQQLDELHKTRSAPE